MIAADAQNIDDDESTVQFTHPALASWKRRLAALALDVLVLGVCGQILALPFLAALYTIGPYGRLIGLLIAMLYFGVCSRIGRGQTIGKHVTGIAVCGPRGEAVGPGRCLTRAFVFVVPWFALGLVPPTLDAVASIVLLPTLVVLTLGLGLAQVLFVAANRRSHQALHDAVCKTRVVALGPLPTRRIRL